jgi:hypothetical protein
MPEYLFARYDTPAYLHSAWDIAPGQEAFRQQSWFIRIARGASFRRLELLEILGLKSGAQPQRSTSGTQRFFVGHHDLRQRTTKAAGKSRLREISNIRASSKRGGELLIRSLDFEIDRWFTFQLIGCCEWPILFRAAFKGKTSLFLLCFVPLDGRARFDLRV